ncbi:MULTISPECIES: GNAT family N-acetyltransferase [Streptomyces]|uniref:GNAT family N-acetyltransferase n=2 Tax=Streptomyces TaxID=1883 RepID=A0ABU4KCK2_9ACTN|nr:GNAT family N-acetyltransferase [Streptomyces roseolus]MDX2295509.1 GNAT family N-acetyltransferase [Streptomyces roseolus]
MIGPNRIPMPDRVLGVEVSDVTVRPLAAGEFELAGRIVGLAFADNPSNLATVGGDREKAIRAMEQGTRIIKLENSSHHALGAEREGRLVGLMNAVEWPHCQMTLGEKLKSAPVMMRTIGRNMPRAFKIMSSRAKHEPREPHWHLGPLAVHPDEQGRGIGTTLFRAFLDRIDEQGAPAFLQADVDRNVALYQKFGFEVVSRETILGVDTRFMWRAAR